MINRARSQTRDRHAATAAMHGRRRRLARLITLLILGMALIGVSAQASSSGFSRLTAKPEAFTKLGSRAAGLRQARLPRRGLRQARLPRRGLHSPLGIEPESGIRGQAAPVRQPAALLQPLVPWPPLPLVGATRVADVRREGPLHATFRPAHLRRTPRPPIRPSTPRRQPAPRAGRRPSPSAPARPARASSASSTRAPGPTVTRRSSIRASRSPTTPSWLGLPMPPATSIPTRLCGTGPSRRRRLRLPHRLRPTPRPRRPRSARALPAIPPSVPPASPSQPASRARASSASSTRAAWTDCDSPQSYSGLAVADHTFSVRATDAAGNVDASPATRSWTVEATPPPPPPPGDTTPPQTSIGSGPSGDTTQTSRQLLLQRPARRARASSASWTRAPGRPAARRSPIRGSRSPITASRCGRPTRPATSTPARRVAAGRSRRRHRRLRLPPAAAELVCRRRDQRDHRRRGQERRLGGQERLRDRRCRRRRLQRPGQPQRGGDLHQRRLDGPPGHRLDHRSDDPLGALPLGGDPRRRRDGDRRLDDRRHPEQPDL